MNYASPRDFRSALQGRARAAARTGTRTVSELLEHFFLARLLARVFHHEPDRWVLKGGQALLVRYPDARHSRDVDLLYRPGDAPDLDAAITALNAAAGIDLDDHLRFEFHDYSDALAVGVARRTRFAVYIGNTRMAVLGVDLVVDHLPVGKTVISDLPPMFDLNGIGRWPAARLYPIVDHVADKICAMVERHGPKGLVSSRYRDLVDLVLIVLREDINGEELHMVLHTEVRRRQARSVQITLPERFQIPDSTWESGYAKQAAAVPLLAEFRTLAAAAELASAFVDPLLGPRHPGTWRASQRGWSS